MEKIKKSLSQTIEGCNLFVAGKIGDNLKNKLIKYGIKYKEGI